MSDDSDQSATALMSGNPGGQAGDDFYARSVADFGESHSVVSTAAIYSGSGVKLVDAGIRLDKRLYEQLMNHRLRGSIDENLAVEGAVDSAGIVAEAKRLIDERTFCQRLVAATGGEERFFETLRRVPLPTQVAFKLTLMRDTRQELFVHSVQMTLVAIHLGRLSGLEPSAVGEVASAALLHDLGVLHIEPMMLKSGHRMSIEEHRHLVAHPVTAALILKEHPQYPPAVVAAVLEHHERLDGSGYPKGKSEGSISYYGKILMLAEVVSAMFERNWDAPGLRLSLILRLNHRKFDRDMVNSLAALLRDEARSLTDAGMPELELARIQSVARVFESWRAQAGLSHPAERFLAEKIPQLERTLSEAGLDPAMVALVLAEPDREPETVSELALLSREAWWQIDRLAHDVRRRWPEIDSQEAPAACDFLRSVAETMAGK